MASQITHAETGDGDKEKNMLTPQRLATLLALTALLAVAVMLYAGAHSAKAAPLSIAFEPQAQAQLQKVGYASRYHRTYMPETYAKDPAYRTYSKRYHSNSHDEVRALQRLFPETNWPPSMR